MMDLFNNVGVNKQSHAVCYTCITYQIVNKFIWQR